MYTVSCHAQVSSSPVKNEYQSTHGISGSVTVTENRPPPSAVMGRSVSSPVNGCSRSVMSGAPAFSAARYTSVPASAAPNGRRKALFLDSCTIM